MANAPVEAKVKASTAATFVVSLLVAVLNAVADSTLLQPLPSWLQGPVIALAPAAVTFLSGWLAEHTPREQP